MAASQDHQAPRFRFRVSTALVFFGLIFLPWSTYFFDRPHFLGDRGYAYAAFNFIVYDFSAQVMFFGFVMAFGSLFWFAYKRHWRAVMQVCLEMVVSFGAFILLPAY
jgi:hypothetical protein